MPHAHSRALLPRVARGDLRRRFSLAAAYVYANLDGQELTRMLAGRVRKRGHALEECESRSVEAVLVGEGDQVNPGDVLARLSAPGED